MNVDELIEPAGSKPAKKKAIKKPKISEETQAVIDKVSAKKGKTKFEKGDLLFDFHFPKLKESDVRLTIPQVVIKAMGGVVDRSVIVSHIVFHKIPVTYTNHNEFWPHAIAIDKDSMPLQAFKTLDKLLLWCKDHGIIIDQDSLATPQIINEVK